MSEDFCPTCGQTMVLVPTQFGNRPLCKNWKCWDIKPSDPWSIEHGGLSPGTSEIKAFSQSIFRAFNQHGAFLSRVDAANGEPPNTALSAMLSVAIDVMWSVFVQKADSSANLEGLKRAFTGAIAMAAGMSVMRDPRPNIDSPPKQKLN